MEKRYQVFVSSTYTDLKAEREKARHALLQMGHMPAGMEIFPAVDQQQFEFIKRIIDDCDYYLLIIGGRYGATIDDGMSYTEKEYEYAVSKGLKVIALLHSKPDEIALKNSEKNPDAQQRLQAFREKVKEGRLVSFWEKAEDIEAKVILGVTEAIRQFPAVGWVRASQMSTEEVLTDINELRKENKELVEKLAVLTPDSSIPRNIAALDEEYSIRGTTAEATNAFIPPSIPNRTLSWNEIFAPIAPYIVNDVPHQAYVRKILASHVFVGYLKPDINDQDWQTITVQFQALGLIEVQRLFSTRNTYELYWSATPKGKQLCFDLRAIRTQKSPP
jgi:hypothetical protein